MPWAGSWGVQAPAAQAPRPAVVRQKGDFVLLGFYGDYAGRIAIGDAELRRLGVAALRRLVALVPQDEYFFNATVAENIAFGADGAETDFGRIVEAAKRAGAHEFIMRLEAGGARRDSRLG